MLNYVICALHIHELFKGVICKFVSAPSSATTKINTNNNTTMKVENLFKFHFYYTNKINICWRNKKPENKHIIIILNMVFC